MSWEYLRKEVADKRLDAFLTEKGDEGWELAYVRRGKETRVNRDPDVWEVIFRRLRSAQKPVEAEVIATVREEAPAAAEARSED